MYLQTNVELEQKLTRVLELYNAERLKNELEKRKNLPKKHDLPSFMEICLSNQGWYKQLHPKVTETMQDLTDNISLNPDDGLSFYKRGILYMECKLFEDVQCILMYRQRKISKLQWKLGVLTI